VTTSDTVRYYDIENLTDKRFRFLINRERIDLKPDEKIRADTTIKKFRILVKELPLTHAGIIEVTPIIEEVDKK
jgi:hypothetical protein